MLTSQSSSPAQAISWTWISPVTCEDRVRKHASWRPAGSIWRRSRRAPQKPDLARRPDSDPAVPHRHAHGALEVMK